MNILSRRRSNKPSWWLTFVQVRINENEKKAAICIFFFFLIICISLFFSYFLLPVTNSPTFFISWFCFDCLWFSFVLHIILARRWRSISHQRRVDWVDFIWVASGESRQPSRYTERNGKRKTKTKKKGTKPKNISWYLFGESRPSVSRIWLTAVIECRESWRRIKAALLQANASRIAWQPTMSLGSRYTQPLGYWVIAHEMKYNKIKATRIDVKLPMTYMHLQNRAMRWMNSTLNLFLCQLKWI